MVSDNDQCPIYKTKKTHLLCKSFKGNICFKGFKKLYEDRVGLFLGLANWSTIFWADGMG